MRPRAYVRWNYVEQEFNYDVGLEADLRLIADGKSENAPASLGQTPRRARPGDGGSLSTRQHVYVLRPHGGDAAARGRGAGHHRGGKRLQPVVRT